MQQVDLSCYLRKSPPSREEVEQIAARYIADHERRFMRQGMWVGVAYTVVQGAIGFGVLWWLSRG